MREDFFLLQNFITNAQSFDWVTILTLFLIGLFYALPSLLGRTLTGRARGCFLGAIWVLVIKLFLHLIQILLLNLDHFYRTVGPRGGGFGGGSGEGALSVVVLVFFPVLEGMLFVLAVVLFVAGLPGLLQQRESWEPPPRRDEDNPR